jgi:hypothetical protein
VRRKKMERMKKKNIREILWGEDELRRRRRRGRER